MPDNNHNSKLKRVAIVSAFIYSETLTTKNKKRQKKRRVWQKTWLAERMKYNNLNLLHELRQNEPNNYRNYLRMDAKSFDDLLHRLEPFLKKQDTCMRESIPPVERLIATLRFLATGRSYADLKFSTGISPQALGYIIPETCRVIFEVLKEEFLKFPSSKEEWKDIARGFDEIWQMPNCGGAIDGKHIRIWAPSGTGSAYYNYYKHFYSIILMAMVNSKYEFVYVDVGKNGRNSDGGVLQHTPFYGKLIDNKLNLPPSCECKENLNFVFIGDEAFPLHKHILKPFSQSTLTYERRIYNYRLSRGRNVVENAFGLITARFRVLHTTINMNPVNIQFIVLAICALHNYLIKTTKQYIGPTTVDLENRQTHEIMENAEWRQGGVPLCSMQTRNMKNFNFDAKNNRNEYMAYFNGNGKVTWQDEMLTKGKA